MTAIAATCKWCGQEFSSKTKCEKHAKTCQPCVCEQCDEKFKSKSALQEHMKTHRQRWQCNLCDITPFKAKAQLEEHCFKDHNISIQCPICDKTFKDPYKRDRHVRVQHSDDPKFRCQCGYKFQDAAKLSKHEEKCVLSKKGATIAIKRKFADLCAEMDDRNAACTQAFSEVRAAAAKRFACKCAHCGICLASDESLKRHLRELHK